MNLSQYMALEPGDLICTGTPEGVAFSGRFPYLKAGDVVEIEIEGPRPPAASLRADLNRLSAPCPPAPAAAAHLNQHLRKGKT